MKCQIKLDEKRKRRKNEIAEEKNFVVKMRHKKLNWEKRFVGKPLAFVIFYTRNISDLLANFKGNEISLIFNEKRRCKCRKPFFTKKIFQEILLANSQTFKANNSEPFSSFIPYRNSI